VCRTDYKPVVRGPKAVREFIFCPFAIIITAHIQTQLAKLLFCN